MKEISIIAAVSLNGVIGKNGCIPWQIPSDLKNFRNMTLGKPIIMGKKTYMSLPKALPGRDNIVLTSEAPPAVNGFIFASDMHEALRIAEGCKGDEVMVIGGESVYKEALPMACRVYLTEVHAHLDGDAFFPLDAIRDWREAAREKPRDVCEDEYDCTFRLLQR